MVMVNMSETIQKSLILSSAKKRGTKAMLIKNYSVKEI